jgi:hypothetical protein
MLTEADSQTAYRYLVQRMRTLGFDEAAQEVESAAAVRVEEYRPPKPDAFSVIELREQGDHFASMPAQ